MEELIKKHKENLRKLVSLKLGGHDLKYPDYGCDGASEECCGNCGGEYFDETKLEEFILDTCVNSIKEILEAEVERLRDSVKVKQRLTTTENTWYLVDGYNKSTIENIEHLTNIISNLK